MNNNKAKQNTTELTSAELFEMFRGNVYPGMLEDLAEKLGPGITVAAIEELGVGYFPGEACWVFAERDAKGNIIGLQRQYHNGKKFMVPGSKRGLIYPFNPDHEIGDKRYDAGKFGWIQIHRTGLTCPICAKSDWCRVSPDYVDREGPSAVACSRIHDGSVREIPPDGHLFILDAARQSSITGSGRSVLPPTDLPIPIVEGPSDVLAAMSLGFVAIGRPSAPGGMEILKDMPLAGKEIWIIGENDIAYRPADNTPYYPGKEGMQKTFINVRSIAEVVKCILPPKEIKDLRKWVQGGLTQASLFEYVGEHGDDNKTIDPNLFASDAASHIAKRLMDEQYRLDGVPLLRNYHGQWTMWNEGRHENLDSLVFEGGLWRFVEGKQFVKPNVKDVDNIVDYKATRAKIKDIAGALSMWCPVKKDPPTYLEPKDTDPDPSDLIICKNGMLDVENYIRTGNVDLLPPDPRLFAYNIFPYDFDPDAESALFEDTINDIFNGDAECIRILAQWFGYNLVPDMTLEKLIIFIGDTRSGKGTLLETLHGMLGSNQYSATDFQTLASKHGLYSLVGKLAATLGDARTPRKTEAGIALQTILKISGGDPVTVDPKYVQPFDIHLTCRFTIAMNNLPGFHDPAKALLARSLILNFPNSYVGREDPTLKKRLKKEASEGKLVNFALRGLKDLREQGKFTMPASSESLLRQLEELTAPVTAFIGECCFKDPKACVTKDTLFEAWQIWCQKNGHSTGVKSYFGRWVKQNCPSAIAFQPRLDGRQQRAYRGIGLCDWVYESYLGRPKSRIGE